MKWFIYLAIPANLCLSTLVSFTAYGQALPRATSANKTALMEGTVLDGATRKPISGAVISAKSQDGTLRAQQATTADGKFQLTLDPKQPYIVTTKAQGYEPLEERLAFTSPNADRLTRRPTYLYRVGTQPIAAPSAVNAAAKAPVSSPGSTSVAAPTALPEARVIASGSATSKAPVSPSGARLTPPKTLDAKVIYTPPLVVAPAGKTTQLRAIQFVQSKAELLPDAQPALEQLLAFMQTNATAEIMLAGHTDNQGDFDENLKLSQQRVDVVKAYLVQNGIAASRITARGYGPTRPIANNNNAVTRQQNRRVELIVLKP